MVLVGAIRDYVAKMLSELTGMKVLIVDKETLGFISVVFSQSDILHKDVYLVEPVDAPPTEESLGHLKAVCFLRPTGENITQLKRHLKNPRYGEYHLFFSNILKSTYIQILADADEHEVVRGVQEYFGDYFAIDPYHFTLNLPSNHLCMVPSVMDPHASQRAGDRIVEGLASVFLSLKKRPVIRYQRSSEIARRIASDVGKLMYEQESGLFDFRRGDNTPLLLVLDRRDDPVTPLLNQWTYQAMVHELIGLEDNRVDLGPPTGAKAKTEAQQLVLSQEQDAFFKANMYENFGDLGANIKKMVDEFQAQSRSNQNLQTLQDMARFVENYPEFRKKSGNVSKHVSLMSELSRIVDERILMSVSQIEQDLACTASQATAFEEVSTQLDNEKVGDVDRLRLVLLYALRYEKENPRQLEQLMTKLSSRPSKYKPALVYTLLRHAGVEKRTGDLYMNRDFINRARNIARGLKGVENVYTQHQPLLTQTMENIAKGRLKDVDYPFVGSHYAPAGRPQDVVVFIVGGSTYEESRAVALQNNTASGVKFVLGGTVVHNSASFLSDLEEVYRLERTSDLV
ncbi:VPS45 vacuolar protein sorting 45 [Klebsormidium nitens]|uniref:VPS45 vacuolar protein sorting 45 n=1 Tax=Klebsormidium nitens TaxID=105231 RepID=A0A1Y1IA96_KLENI|nr:VPS45 vacuolar protein sorting 45 [Klebsormidium nitens]|eukprot:GAQ85616.1 VPS45 vacuolar protein sorting 45 [Klebsormidium nitens]